MSIVPTPSNPHRISLSEMLRQQGRTFEAMAVVAAAHFLPLPPTARLDEPAATGGKNRQHRYNDCVGTNQPTERGKRKYE